MNDQADKGNNPKWKPFLDALPESLHSQIIPVLREWDAGVTKQFQEIHQSYEGLKPFKKFVDNGIDADYAEKAVIFSDQLQQDPAKTIAYVNETWKLGFVTPEQAAALRTNEATDDFDIDNLDDDDDILKNPKVKAILDGAQQVQEEWKTLKEQEEEQAQYAEFEEYLENLEKATTEKNLPFNKLFVTALMQQGIDGEEAVNQYHQALALNTSDTQTDSTEQVDDSSKEVPPVVMGGNGVTGSGLPDGTVNFGSQTKNQLNDTVMQMLAEANNSGQG